MKKLLLAFGICGALIFSGLNSSAQVKETRQEKKEQREAKDKAERVKQAQKNVANIEALNFSFYPNTVEPEFGITNPLTGMGDYYFTVDKTNFYMNLPYIGRFYITPMSPENVPINLTCNKFLYAVHSTDGINIQVTIIPSSNDIMALVNQGIRFVFNLNKNTGYAKLVVTSDERQEITYTGSFN